jgi:amino acid transporter
VLSGQTLIAMSAAALALIVLYRSILAVDKIVRWLGVVVVLTLLFIIFAGFAHFNAKIAFDFPPGAWHLNSAFFMGLGAGLLVAAYDYGGYYSVCFMGAEVRDPQRTIPRAVLGSVVIVGALYLLMNVSVLGVLPWREIAEQSANSHARMFTMAVFMERIYGHGVAAVTVVLIAVAALCSVLALLLGQSRIPFAAARDGNFPAWFGAIHPKLRIPHHAMLWLGGLTMAFCVFRLQEVITALVVIRILFQFLLQAVAVMLPQHQRERKVRGYRMPLYPLPALLALGGFLFILFSRPNFHREIRTAGLVLVAGLIVFGLRNFTKRDRSAL